MAPGWVAVAVRVRGAMIACQGPRSMSVSPFPMADQAQATSSTLASLDMPYLVEHSLIDYCKWMLQEELDLAELNLISSPSKNFPSLWGKKKSDLAEVTMSKKAGWVVAAARRGIDVESQSLTRWKSLMINKFPGLAVQIHFSGNLNRIFYPFTFSNVSKFQCYSIQIPKILQILRGSFSAASKPNFARKYAFCSICQFYKICTLLHRSKLNILAKINLKKQQFS